jgi:hypothetical protein
MRKPQAKLKRKKYEKLFGPDGAQSGQGRNCFVWES